MLCSSLVEPIVAIPRQAAAAFLFHLIPSARIHDCRVGNVGGGEVGASQRVRELHLIRTREELSIIPIIRLANLF